MFPIRDHNPAERTPYVTYGLMAVNILIGLLSFGLDTQALNQFYIDYALFPAQFTAGQGTSGLFTSMFLHAGFMHLAGNMLFLFIFGDNMEDQMGHVPFLVFYLASGAAAGLAQVAADPGSMIPMVGASGAIAGVMGGYLLLFPKARVDILLILIVFIRTFPVPAWIMLGLWFAMQLLGGFNSLSGDGGVAYWAHAGGFVAGLILTFPLWQRRGATSFWDRTHGHPPYPDALPIERSRVPRVTRK